jgi:hypothetical protein
MFKGSKVIVTKFNGETVAPANCDPSENYWLLIGKTGKIAKKEKNSSKVLVEFDVSIQNLGLNCHSEAENSLYFSESDLNVIYEKINRTIDIKPTIQNYSINIPPLFKKCFAIIISILAICNLFGVAHAIYSGRIKDMSRYSRLIVYIDSNPVKFWISFWFHLALGLFVSSIAYYLLVNSGLVKNIKFIDKIMFKVNSITPDVEQSVPIHIVIFVLFIMFAFFAYVTFKWYL